MKKVSRLVTALTAFQSISGMGNFSVSSPFSSRTSVQRKPSIMLWTAMRLERDEARHSRHHPCGMN
eukprot:7079128-Prymnesium_polylepis.1